MATSQVSCKVDTGHALLTVPEMECKHCGHFNEFSVSQSSGVCRDLFAVFSTQNFILHHLSCQTHHPQACLYTPCHEQEPSLSYSLSQPKRA